MANVIRLKRASGSDPSASDLVSGEPAVRTDTGELFFKKDDGSIAKVAGAGGGPDFKYLALRNAANNGAASYPNADFTLVTSGTTTAITPTAANTLLVSVNGVIQKPNTGTSTPSQGFALSGSTIKFGANISAAPDFILYQESGGIGEPSDDTVSEVKLKVSNSPVNGYFLSAQSGNNGGLTWAAPVATSCTGNSATATALATARTINGTSFDGTSNITVTAAAGTLTGNTLNSSVTASSLTSLGDLSGLTVTGNLAVDTSTLFVNASTNRVGFGTTSPRSLLDLGAGSGDGSLSTTLSEYQLMLEAPQTTGDYGRNIGWSVGTNGLVAAINAVDVGSSDATGLAFITGNNSAAAERMRIDSSGRLLLGTTTEGYTGADDLTIATTGSTGISLRSASGNAGNLAFSDGTSGDDEQRGLIQYHHSDDSMRLFTDATRRMTIDSSGNVGIGTTSPQKLLDVRGEFAISNSNASYWDFDRDDSDGSLKIKDTGTERMRIDSSGRVGINETNPSEMLHIKDDGNTDSFGGLIIKSNNNSVNCKYGWRGIDGSGDVRFAVAGTERVRIDSSGFVGIGNTSPTSSHAGARNLVIGAGSGDRGLSIMSGTSGVGHIEFSDGTSNAGEKTAGGIRYYHNGNYMRFNTNGGTERMRIDSSGNVLVGTTDTLSKLTVDTDIGVIRSSSDPTINLLLGTTSSITQLYRILIDDSDGDKLQIRDDDTPRITLDTSGNVGIGTTAPVEKLGVNGDIRLVNPTGTTRRISALPSGSYSVGVSGGAAIGFTRFSDAGGGSDQIIFETHHQGSSHGERMRIDKTGRVLIGTTGHDVSKLYVSGGSFSLAGSDGNFNGGGNRVFLDHDNNDVRFGFTGGGGSATTRGLRFYTVNNASGTSNHNRITPIGEFRICHGANSANSVSTDFVNGIGDTTLNSVQSNLARLVMQERSGNWISFKTGGGTHYGTIARSGSGVSYGSNSDYRLKDNVANLTGGIALVKQLRPVTFNWNDLSGLSKTETHQGFIAHEVQALVSDAVDGEKDGMDIWGDCTDSEGNVTQTHVPESKKKDGETWTKKGEDIHDQQLDTGKLIPILTAALQEAIGRIEALEAK